MGTSNRRINKKDLPIRPKNRTEDLIMYCKLLKYMRTSPAIVLNHGLYRKVCRNEFYPFVKTSPYPWDRQLYYAFWYSEMYGWLVVSLNRLNDVKL